MTNRERWQRWRRRNPTFEATLKRKGRTRKLYLRREPVTGFAMTVLRCAECEWRIYLEAHHKYGSGKPKKLYPENFKSKEHYEQYKKWRMKMMRKKLVCPRCKHDSFKYVRTEVMDHGNLYSELAP